MSRRKSKLIEMSLEDAKFALIQYFEDMIDYVQNGEVDDEFDADAIQVTSAIKVLLDNKIL